MNVEELMFGNYVYLDYPDGHRVIMRVTGIIGNTVHGISSDNSLRGGDAGMVKPIPLTTEILESIGFSKSTPPPGIHARCYDIDNKKDRYHLTIADYNKYKRLLLDVDSEDSECFNIKCDYVHELQLALVVCKIKKTITL
jgi:hypothetical protein